MSELEEKVFSSITKSKSTVDVAVFITAPVAATLAAVGEAPSAPS